MSLVPYCGIGVIKKGMRRGTPQECYNMNQLRYYGLEKVNIDDVELREKGPKKAKWKIEAEMRAKISIIRTKIKRLTEKIDQARHQYEIRSPGDKEEFKMIVDNGEFELKKLKIQLKNAIEDFEKYKIKSQK